MKQIKISLEDVTHLVSEPDANFLKKNRYICKNRF